MFIIGSTIFEGVPKFNLSHFCAPKAFPPYDYIFRSWPDQTRPLYSTQLIYHNQG